MFDSNSCSIQPSPLKLAILHFLHERSYSYNHIEEEELITMNLSGDNCTWTVILQADEDRKLVQVRSLCPLKVKDSQKLRVAELLCRINYQLLLGNFILDFEDGEIIFSTCNYFFDASSCTIEAMNIIFQTNTKTLDEYLPAIIAVNSGFVEPIFAFHQSK